jgi:hypothetical protein
MILRGNKKWEGKISDIVEVGSLSIDRVKIPENKTDTALKYTKLPGATII